jgi:hypothetical protein
VEAQRDFHKIQGNLKVVTVPTPTLAPSTAGVDGSSATVRGRQTSSVEDDPSHHLFTVVVPRRTLRPQETQQSPGEGGGQRFPMTSSTDVTSGSSSTVTWTTLTGTRFSTGSSTASGGPTTTEMITRPTIPASKEYEMNLFIMLMSPPTFHLYSKEEKEDDLSHARLVQFEWLPMLVNDSILCVGQFFSSDFLLIYIFTFFQSIEYCTLERSNERVVHFPEGTIKRVWRQFNSNSNFLKSPASFF